MCSGILSRWRFVNTHECAYSTPGFEHAHSLALSIKRSTTTLPRTQLSQTIEAKSRQSTPPEDPIYVGWGCLGLRPEWGGLGLLQLPPTSGYWTMIPQAHPGTQRRQNSHLCFDVLKGRQLTQPIVKAKRVATLA